jgi:flagellar basal-body rod protein FlgC
MRMQISSNVSVSAMQAYKDAVDVTANNVANANTDGFKRSSSVFGEKESGGVQRRSAQDPQAVKVVEAEEMRELSNTDFAKEASELITYEASAKMSITAFKTQQRMSEAAVNLIA